MIHCLKIFGNQKLFAISCFHINLNLSQFFLCRFFHLGQFAHKNISVHKGVFFNLYIFFEYIHPVLQQHKLSSTTVSEIDAAADFSSLQDGIAMPIFLWVCQYLYSMWVQSVRVYVLTSSLVQYNVLVEFSDPKPFMLMVICQIHTSALKTYTILILQDLILLMVLLS